MKLDKHFVEGAAHTRLLLAVCLLVSLGQVEVAYEGVVDEGLENNAHEARLAHVVETAQAYGAAGEKGGVADYELVVFGRGRVFVLALLAYISGSANTRRRDMPTRYAHPFGASGFPGPHRR